MAVERNPELLAAWRAHYKGDNNDAIERFNKIIASQPQNTDALNGLGLAQKAVGDHLGARVTFRKLLDILERKIEEDPDNETRYRMEMRMIQQQIEMLDI
ncbi:MAG: hypothetical protein CUN55_06525 [Phototrophicales bacterium]|nr:MAG: hypothetical protein CUN55_06525 [Phototrophicales bacterium]